MIRSFANKETECIWEGLLSRRLPQEVQDVGHRNLPILNRVSSVEELRILPGNRLERLVGNRKGQWSIRINAKWRICFKWENGEAHHVEIADYH